MNNRPAIKYGITSRTPTERVHYLLFCALILYAQKHQKQGDHMVTMAKEVAALHNITFKYL